MLDDDDLARRASENNRNSSIGRRKAVQKEAFKVFLSSAGGRGWLWDVLEQCHIFVVPGPIDPVVMAFKEGERNVGMFLLAEAMREFPEVFGLMTKEANERSERTGVKNDN